MKGILAVEEIGINLELENITVDQFMMTRKTPVFGGAMVTHETIGKPITLITDNMPEPLLAAIQAMVSGYCKP